MLPLAEINWESLSQSALLGQILKATVLLCLGLPIVMIGSRVISRGVAKRFSTQAAFVSGKVVLYGGYILLTLTLLLQFGFNLTTVLGAAGVASVAVGFAAQTSLSNLISGIFLLWEQPFKVGDAVTINGRTGVVLSIDLLSVKIRTFDNLYIRIPNQTIIQSEVTTVTRFPIRRLDITVGIAYKEDLRRVMVVLREVAEANPFCLDDPEPFLVIQEFGASSINIQLGAWCVRENYVALKNSLIIDIKERLDKEGIEIPFPQVTLSGLQGAPVIVSSRTGDASGSREAPEPADKA